jgi:hypothetical protein
VDTNQRELSLQEQLGPRFYWLCRCEGFRVESPEGKFGLVEAVMFRIRPDEPDALIVRAGVLGRKLVIVPIEDVTDIVPRRQRVMLKRVPDFSGADFLTDVRTRLRRLAAESASGQSGLALRGGNPLPEA